MIRCHSKKHARRDDVVGEKNNTAEHFRKSSFRHRSFKMYLLIRSASTRTRKAQGLVPGKSERRCNVQYHVLARILSGGLLEYKFCAYPQLGCSRRLIKAQCSVSPHPRADACAHAINLQIQFECTPILPSPSNTAGCLQICNNSPRVDLQAHPSYPLR